MIQRPSRQRILITLAALGAAILPVYGWNQYTLHHPNREHAMTELTKNMKTVCFGRYLVDIPAQAEFSIATATIDDINIEYVGTSLSERIFLDRVKKREAELRSAKHNTEGTRLREATDINDGQQRLLVYREDPDDTSLTWVETAVRSGAEEWLVSFRAADDDVAEVKKIITGIASQVTARKMDQIPKTPGACIRSGLVTGNGYPTENFPASMKVKLPAFTLGISSETSGPTEHGQRLWDRIDKANSLGKEFFNTSLNPLRRAEVVVDGRKGQEYVSTLQDKEVEHFSAHAEVDGDGTPKLPSFEISMDISRPLKPDPSSKEKTLSNEEALAVWDAVLKTIRPRPGAF